MLRNTDLGQPECFTEFCQLVKFLQLGHQELKYMCVFFAFLETTLHGNLFHFTS